MTRTESIIEKTLERLPHWDLTESPPEITTQEYELRLATLRAVMRERKLSHVVVYADREHFSNLEYLTGYDPRFEEALLIVSSYERNLPILIVGNEGLAYSEISPVMLVKELYQDFSLQGQPRGQSKPLDVIFNTAGIGQDSKVGIIGIKYLGENQKANELYHLDIPAYIADTLRTIVNKNNVINVTDIMTHPEKGLRTTNLSSTEIALCEIAGTQVSLGLENFLLNLRLGMTEIEAAKLLQLDGSPLNVHINVNFGRIHAGYGLASPTYTKRAESGDIINVCNSKRRALVARTGIMVSNVKEIKPEMEGVVDNFYKPYFAALVNWYESIKIGVSGGEVYEKTMEILGNKNFDINLNPGHLIHTEEWSNSPFFKNSSYLLKSGMVIQCDIIAMSNDQYFGVHVEDGIALADEHLREEIKQKYPHSWNRINKRRKFIQDELGVKLQDEVLPLSNLQLILNPYMLNPKIVLAVHDR